jgi:hypothetical protein
VVLVISQNNLPEPCTDLDHAIMHPALKLNLDGFEFRNHSLLRSDPPYGEGSALVALPTVVGEAQERDYAVMVEDLRKLAAAYEQKLRQEH